MGLSISWAALLTGTQAHALGDRLSKFCPFRARLYSHQASTIDLATGGKVSMSLKECSPPGKPGSGRRLPTARVCPAVHVQHLAGDGSRLSKVNNSVGNVLRLRDYPHGRQSFHIVLRSVLM